jgi:hypothetical protein
VISIGFILTLGDGPLINIRILLGARNERGQGHRWIGIFPKICWDGKEGVNFCLKCDFCAHVCARDNNTCAIDNRYPSLASISSGLLNIGLKILIASWKSSSVGKINNAT